jgi:hypothetical protein
MGLTLGTRAGQLGRLGGMDRDLREAERSGDPVALLRERLRAGELTQAHVELAASLGHAAARELCPEVELVVDWYYESHDAITAAASLLGETLPARIAADWAERGLPLWKPKSPRDNAPRDAIAAARAWANCPCEAHKVAASEAAAAARAGSQIPHDPTMPLQNILGANLVREEVGSAAAAAASVAACADALAADAALNVIKLCRLAVEAANRSNAADGAAAAAAAASAAVNANDLSLATGSTAALSAHDGHADEVVQRLRLAAYVLGEVETDELAA